ncbi:hypothetical protein BGZ81_000828 [Podila clonocystis]|nr:hypothetical protein BGZ81_000828 [Podila clonocystis]
MVKLSLSRSFLFVALSLLSAVVAFPVITSEMAPSQCMPSINSTLNQSSPFNLCVFANYSQVTQRDTSQFLVPGEPYSISTLELEFCVVATDMNCTYSRETDCVHENVEYRIRSFRYGLTQGYLHVQGSQIEVVPSFQAASGFYLSKSATGSSNMYITHVFPTGQTKALTYKGPA